MKHVTIKQAKESHPLAPAVLRQLGGGEDAVNSAVDAANHGADGGFHGFCYYVDTCGFTKRNRKSIAEVVEQMADDFGEGGPIALVRGFNCLKGNKYDDRHIAAALYSSPPKHDFTDTIDAVDLVENALAWFALEEVGRAIQDLQES